jgi:hypothetical protein
VSAEVEWIPVDAVAGIVDGVAVHIYGLPSVCFRWEALLSPVKKWGRADTLDAAKAAAVAAVRDAK